jgi:hypothetical protein
VCKPGLELGGGAFHQGYDFCSVDLPEVRATHDTLRRTRIKHGADSSVFEVDLQAATPVRAHAQ